MDFFYHDTRSLDDYRVHTILRTYGLEGYGIWNLLLEAIYQNGGTPKGFFFEITTEWLEAFSKAINVPTERIESIIDLAAEMGMITIEERVVVLCFYPDATHKPGASSKSYYRIHTDEVFKRDGYKCVYCGSTEKLTLDHIVPKSKGGSNNTNNLACCCRSCNSSKKDKSLEEWLK